MIIRVTRTIDSTGTTSDPRTDDILTDFQATMTELKCVGSERMLRQGISMTQLHVMNMLERHGEVAMSRLAEMLDVSDSNATGLIDRIEERGFVERIRVPSDRRVVLVRITDRGREVMEEVETLREEMLERMLGRLDEPNLMRVAAAMSDLRQAIVTTVADPNSGVSHTHEPQGRD